MKYNKIISGTFLSRPNRFVARVLIDGTEETVHVKNTGRCRELLIPGCTVWLSCSDNPDRKTKYDLVAVENNCAGRTALINIDSQAPNAAVAEWLPASGLFPTDAVIRSEAVFGNSRFDFRIEHDGAVSYLEVKGVTLELDGTAFFPDAPTERGVKHLNELISCTEQGFGAYVLFVIQMKGVNCVRPNDDTHRKFGEALRRAAQAGVRIMAVDCTVAADSMVIDGFIPVDLS